MSITVGVEYLTLADPAIALAGGTWIAPVEALALSSPVTPREQAFLVGAEALALSGPALAAVHYGIASLWTVYATSDGQGGGPGAVSSAPGVVPWDGEMPAGPALPFVPTLPFLRD